MQAKRASAEALLGIAAIAAGESRFDAAARLRGASLALHELSGSPPNPVERRIERQFLSVLPTPMQAAGEAEGRTMTLDEMASYALDAAKTLTNTA